jgi:hypothetical protein
MNKLDRDLGLCCPESLERNILDRPTGGKSNGYFAHTEAINLF